MLMHLHCGLMEHIAGFFIEKVVELSYKTLEAKSSLRKHIILMMSIQIMRRSIWLYTWDALLVIKQLLGLWQVKKYSLKTWFYGIKKLARDFDAIQFKHVPRETNHLCYLCRKRGFEGCGSIF